MRIEQVRRLNDFDSSQVGLSPPLRSSRFQFQFLYWTTMKQSMQLLLTCIIDLMYILLLVFGSFFIPPPAAVHICRPSLS